MIQYTAATIGFSDSAIAVTEGSQATACAQVMNSQQLDRDIIFTMATADGSALASQDYSPLNAELSFNPTNDQQLLCMNIGTTDDSSTEGNETFFVDIITSAAQVSVDPSRLMVTIIDNDAGIFVCRILPPLSSSYQLFCYYDIHTHTDTLTHDHSLCHNAYRYRPTVHFITFSHFNRSL